MTTAIAPEQAVMQIVDENRELRENVASLSAELEELKKELAVAKEAMKKYEIFSDIVDEDPQWFSYTIKDKGNDSRIVQRLWARSKQLYGGAIASTRGEVVGRMTQDKLNRVIMACVKDVVDDNTRWRQMVNRQLSAELRFGA